MPRIAINYSNTVIYKIVCKDLNIKDCYIGHTTDFIRRRYNHKCSSVNNLIKYKIYQTINENGGWDNWDMVLVEKLECNNELEARARERYWIEQLGATLNVSIPTRTTKEYYENNKSNIILKQQTYYENNKEKVLEYHKKRYTCVCGTEICKVEKSRHEKTKKHQKAMANLETNATV